MDAEAVEAALKSTASTPLSVTDRRTDGPTDQRTDGPTNQRTDGARCRVACTRLKRCKVETGTVTVGGINRVSGDGDDSGDSGDGDKLVVTKSS